MVDADGRGVQWKRAEPLIEAAIPAGLLGVMALGLLLMGGGVTVSARKAE